MKTKTPFYLRFSIQFCRQFSYLFAAAYWIGAQTRLANIPSCIREAPGGMFQNLRKRWFACLLKKLVSILVRSPLKSHILQLVKVDLPDKEEGGMILVTCHTPWKRLLVRWVHEHHYAWIIDTNKSLERMNRMRRQRKGYNEWRHVIRHLRMGGRIIIAADTFNKLKNCPSAVMGKSGNLSLLPIRLARMAGVPMIAVVPELRQETIHIHQGPRFDREMLAGNPHNLMQNILGFFEGEIKRNPAIWSYIVNDSLLKFNKKTIE